MPLVLSVGATENSAPYPQLFVCMGENFLSLLFSRPNRHKPLNLSLCEELLSLNHFGGLLLDSFKYLHVSLVMGSPELDPAP